jgi:hypothetical protein
MWICMYVYIYIHTDTHTIFIQTNKHTHIHTHTCMYEYMREYISCLHTHTFKMSILQLSSEHK